MNLTRCKTGHYYDADKFIECPHCDQNVTKTDVSRRGTTFGRGTETRSKRSQKLRDPERKSSSDILAKSQSSSMTQNIWASTDEDVQESKSMTDELATIVSYGSVQSQVVRPLMNENISSPVVGWLVCVQGELFGRGMSLVDGRTRIGSSVEMEIRLVNDRNIERINHAVIMFRSSSKEFLLLGEESQGMVYVNGKSYGNKNVKIQNRDFIQVGNTIFRFVPLCGNDFDWSNPIGVLKPEVAEKPNFYETSVLCAGMAPDNVSQPVVGNSWKCMICGTQNMESQEYCQACGSLRQ